MRDPLETPPCLPAPTAELANFIGKHPVLAGVIAITLNAAGAALKSSENPAAQKFVAAGEVIDGTYGVRPLDEK